MKTEHKQLHHRRLSFWAGFILVMVCLVISVPSIQAGWVDSWLDQKTEAPAGHFEGQKRGYWTGKIYPVGDSSGPRLQMAS